MFRNLTVVSSALTCVDSPRLHDVLSDWTSDDVRKIIGKVNTSGGLA